MYDNRMKIVALILTAVAIFTIFTVFISSDSEPSVSAKSAALYEPTTGRFLYSKDMNKPLATASTTKIMTALLALELLDEEEEIPAYREATGVEGSSIYLKPGEIMSVIDLVYALLLQSANDAAEVLAYRIAGSIEAFAMLMNQKARELGATNTNFKNPHGLDDKEHYTTAHDLALITAAALKIPTFRKICSTYKQEIESSDKTRIVVNHNKLLKMYDGCIGVKTGYTQKSGRSLVSAAERDGLTLIGVTIDAPDDWSDHTSLLDFGFSKLCAVRLAYAGEFSYELPILGSDKESVRISNPDSLTQVFEKDDASYTREVHLTRYFIAPVKRETSSAR